MNLKAISDFDDNFTIGKLYKAKKHRGASVQLEGKGDNWYGLGHFEIIPCSCACKHSKAPCAKAEPLPA